MHEDLKREYQVVRGSDRSLGVLVNTSFNVRSEPIVCNPEDAFRCFMGTEIEVLTAGNCFPAKEAQDPDLKLDYKNRFLPD
jgi:carbamoyltransferase